jgi:hypothetical protein
MLFHTEPYAPTDAGTHFPPEKQPDEIGWAIADFVRTTDHI